jgi:DNA-binding YbaB/EbfC family protein
VVPAQPNLQALLAQAQQMQSQMLAAQADLAEASVDGQAGGGLVRATVSGTGELRRLVIEPSVVDPADVETLADLVVAAVRDATRAARELAETRLGPLAGGGAGLPDLPDLPGLPGLPGN